VALPFERFSSNNPVFMRVLCSSAPHNCQRKVKIKDLTPIPMTPIPILFYYLRDLIIALTKGNGVR
jgi:hypothetical protein